MSSILLDVDCWLEVFVHVDQRSTFDKLRRSCRLFRDLLCGPESASFWSRKCRHDDVLPDNSAISRRLSGAAGFRWVDLWMKRPFGRQLLGPNLVSKERLSLLGFFGEEPSLVWKSSPDGRSTIRMLDVSGLSDRRMLTVPLEEFGLTSILMDEVRPVLRVSEWNCALLESETHYSLTVFLADAEFRLLFATDFHRNRNPGDDCTLRRTELVLRDYPPGARYLFIRTHSRYDAFAVQRNPLSGLGPWHSDAELVVDWPNQLPTPERDHASLELARQIRKHIEKKKSFRSWSCYYDEWAFISWEREFPNSSRQDRL